LIAISDPLKWTLSLTQHADDVSLGVRLAPVAIGMIQSTRYVMPLDGDREQARASQLDGD